MTEKKVTRGNGILEGFLAKQRCNMSNRLIHFDLRKGKILDIGCGSYPFNLINTEFNSKFGLDRVVDENYIEKFNEYGIKLVNFDLEKEGNLPFENDFFEVITMLAVFEHITPEKLPDILSEIKRILKPGGSFIMTIPAFWTDKLLRILAKVGLTSSEEIEEHKDAYSISKIKYFLKKGSFEEAKLKFGYFEIFMNIWAVSTK